jgi:fumarylacetoacetase
MSIDYKAKSWITIPENSDFPVQNIPFGVYKSASGEGHVCTRIGDTIIDLYLLNNFGAFPELQQNKTVFKNNYLNDFIALGKTKTRAVRQRIYDIFSDQKQEKSKWKEAFVSVKDAQMLMPVKVGDYTDFYSSIDHATNVGKMFRDPDNALLPNWKHIPVGYHGRASSIVVSGTDIHRPKGQIVPKGETKPIYTPSRLMDFELEVAFITGKKTALGESISTDKAEDYIFGLTLFNDLSARDIQKWEYVPLGPFLGKNFGSVISPWIVTLEALEPFRTEGYKQEPEVLDYLKYSGDRNFDINLEVYIQPEQAEATRICQSNFKFMYWNMAQQLAHQTVNGCNINVGDMYASGTISGPDESSFGSMLELSWGGQKEISLNSGETRKFIQDNDTVIIKGFGEKDGIRIGFGECVTKILPAL